MIEVIRRWANEHSVQLEKHAALPAAGEVAHTEEIDASPAGVDSALVELHVDATGAAAGKAVMLTLEHSDDGETFVACGGLAGLLLVGDGSTGGTCETKTSQNCPGGMKRFLRLAVEVEDNAGDLSGATAYVALVPQPSAIGNVG